MPDTPKAQTPDPQLGIISILRPYAGFEAIYQGKAASRPIQFTEGGVALDPQAGNPGYSPRLMRGFPVPEGARVVIWMPQVFFVTPGPVLGGYMWSIVWRYRNTFDYRTQRLSYHFPKQGKGVTETGVPPGTGARVVTPAANQGILYSEAEPAGIARGVQNLRSLDVTVDATNPGPGDPILPTGIDGYYQQGISDPGVFGALASDPTYVVFDTVALGDEMLIGARRDVSVVANWNFTAGQADAGFSDLFGTGTGAALPDIGVYVNVGVVP